MAYKIVKGTAEDYVYGRMTDCITGLVTINQAVEEIEHMEQQDIEAGVAGMWSYLIVQE